MSEQKQDNPNRPEPEYCNPGDWRSQRREWRHGMRRRDPFRGLIPGLTLILIGSLLFMANRGTLEWNTWWQYLLVGLGGIFILDGIIHYFPCNVNTGCCRAGLECRGVVYLMD